MKKLILTLALICSISQISALPDMRKVNHNFNKFDQFYSYSSLNPIKMYYTRTKNFSGWRGFCKDTGYSICIHYAADTVDSKCILIKGEEVEESYETMCFTEKYNANYFFKDSLKIVFVSDGNGNNFATLCTDDYYN